MTKISLKLRFSIKVDFRGGRPLPACSGLITATAMAVAMAVAMAMAMARPMAMAMARPTVAEFKPKTLRNLKVRGGSSPKGAHFCF